MNDSIIDGLGRDLGQGGSVAITSILMVFAILLLIIIICECIGKVIELVEKKYLPKVEEYNEASSLDLNDEDATVACLIAAIECRRETHKNVRIVSVREVK